jgi:hypothetical protein
VAEPGIQGQCYCGTTRAWKPSVLPGATSAQYALVGRWGVAVKVTQTPPCIFH